MAAQPHPPQRAKIHAAREGEAARTDSAADPVKGSHRIQIGPIVKGRDGIERQRPVDGNGAGFDPVKIRLCRQGHHGRKGQRLRARGRKGDNVAKHPRTVAGAQKIGAGQERHHGDGIAARDDVKGLAAGPGCGRGLTVPDHDIAADPHIEIGRPCPFEDGHAARSLQRHTGQAQLAERSGPGPLSP